ncbi:MAG: polysaccharide deacetylase family protein [Defluviitaleaceae bacterium]|nr:polysaccharide deacetylase family protein [Defluviitaleaceae bacterium]
MKKKLKGLTFALVLTILFPTVIEAEKFSMFYHQGIFSNHNLAQITIQWIPKTKLENIYPITLHVSNQEIYENIQRIPVLLYHHILPNALNTNHRNNSSVISLEDFEAQMSYLDRNGFTTITITQLEKFLFDGVPLPNRSVMIHFDDGYYSNFVYAMPILERYGFVAQLFLMGKAVCDRGDIQPCMNHAGLTFTAAKTIKGTEHVFETASHTFAKHDLVKGTRHTAFVYDDRDTVKQDLIRSFDFVNNHRTFAYPQGQYSAETIELLQDLGIRMAFTTQKGYITSKANAMILPRNIIFPNTSIQDFSDILGVGVFE